MQRKNERWKRQSEKEGRANNWRQEEKKKRGGNTVEISGDKNESQTNRKKTWPERCTAFRETKRTNRNHCAHEKQQREK